MSIAAAFRVSPYFRGLYEPWLQRLGEVATPRTFARGDALADETASLYLLATGEVSASTPPDADGGWSPRVESPAAGA